MNAEHAVVCGGSMAGLLAAKVLSDFYGSVTVVERDELPQATLQRRGVSQGRHLHMMLSGGIPYLVKLFPGVLDDLADAGAIVLESPDDPTIFHLSVGDRVFCKSGRFIRSGDMVVVLASRPLLEGVIRRRVRQIANITLLDGHDASEPVLTPSGRVNEVRVVNRKTHRETALAADLVVDATGRAARTPAFLQARGYQRPPERRYPIDLTYSSQFFRLTPGRLSEKAVIDVPTLEKPSGAGLLAYEDGTAIVTLLGYAGYRTPTDLTGFLASAGECLPPHVSAVLQESEPIGDVSVQHYPVSMWRRYDKLKRFPSGYLVLGDAFCSFNPVFGQGMTSSAVQASVLHRCLAHGRDDLSRRFFRASAKKLAPMW
ncbi:MAG TPA: 2-polyprenyl-6-methoxyphenol hydroxylase-like oxidoreductase, partial [Mycobacterium sp.]|nr:2-polyprenyl-6-methoxyphenol hydroxylase-like oxidoreductase [Mycobacterium sp.]